MINKLFLDLNNFKPNLGSVERGDSIELNIKLLNDEDYSRSKFRLLGAKSDGKSVEQIEGLNLEEKDLKVVLEDQFVNCEGIVKLELNVVSGETEITTKEFYFFVSNTMNGEIVESSDSVPTLEKVSKYVDDAVNNLDALKEASADIAIINGEFKENEIKRKANEMLREKNEKARLQSEDIRITEEEEREANELERIQAENDRKVDESNRKVSEKTRVTNERAREEAELSRQSTFEENEEIRNSNENLRIASEQERIKFNNNAKTDELNRKEAEKIRVLAEVERKSSEDDRVAAEAIRQNTYTDFNESEQERKNNEVQRQEAEALRIKAETRRDNLFAEKEEERNTTFIESETVREEAFKISEKTRNDAEDLRVTAETERVNAEKARAITEVERTKSEKARAIAEESREIAETSRVEAEKIRNQKLNLFDNRVTDVENDLYHISSNLFDFSKLITGKIPELRIGANKDDFSVLSNWKTTNYIPVKSGEQYCVIKNEVITQQQFTVVYFKDGINIGYDNPASNPFTIKEGADHIYICTGNSDLFIEDKTSVKKHEVDIDLSFKPFGKERQFALKDTVKETGVYIENSNYHHFVKFGDKYLIRTFKREGANNLFQFSSLSIGNVTKKGVTITKKIADNGTDIVGPISIMRQGTDSGGMWAGGCHDVGVDGSRFPTAQQESLKVTINGIDVTNVEGLHYGVVNITTKNKIYFPQTIVGSNLDSAIQSILETRNYTLNDKMNVNVKLDILQDTRVICYYGLQAVRIGFDSIFLPNDEKNIVFNEMNGDYWIEKPNRKVIMGSKDFTYELILKEYGLGNYNHNSGVSSYKFGSLPQNTRKYYQVLIAGDYEHTFLKKGTSLYWEGVYNIYPN